MHGGVGAAFQHRHLELLQEQTLAADFRQRAVLQLVAARGHWHQHHVQARVGFAQAGGHVFGLPEGECAFAGGQSEGRHGGGS